MEFIHKVSKGSRFNQIYIPKSMERAFEVGDIVEVRLVEKKTQLFFIGELKLGEFKEKLIRDVFSFLGKFKEIKQVFFFGSFLTKKIDYNDIDVMIVSDKEGIEEEAYDELAEKFSLKFHVLAVPEKRFLELSEICPLTRSMLSRSVSNRKFKIPGKRIDKKHIEFLLMMPEDLLKIKANSRIFYDSVRRLFVIERFLEGKEENNEEIEREIKKELGEIAEKARKNEEISEKERGIIRDLIKNKLNRIRKHEQKKDN